jgi:DNA-binding transcriptional LysR family regulator
MHPRLLRTFLAAARTRNLTRAADAVHLAQSSASDQIQSLEQELRAPLFLRTRQGLRLTEAGEALKPYAEALLSLAEEARAAVETAAESQGRSLTIGALETIGAMKLPPWLDDFRRRQPGIALHLKIAGSGELLQAVASGALDAAFCFDREPFDERLGRRVIAAEPLVLVGPPAPLDRQAAFGLDALRSSRFIATERGCIYRHLFDTTFAAAGLAPPAIMAEVGSIAAIGRLVAAGGGRALVPRLAVQDLLARGEVAELPWPGRLDAAPLALFWRRRRVQSPALKHFLAAAEHWGTTVRPADARPRHAAPSLS